MLFTKWTNVLDQSHSASFDPDIFVTLAEGLTTPIYTNRFPSSLIRCHVYRCNGLIAKLKSHHTRCIHTLYTGMFENLHKTSPLVTFVSGVEKFFFFSLFRAERDRTRLLLATMNVIGSNFGPGCPSPIMICTGKRFENEFSIANKRTRTARKYQTNSPTGPKINARQIS